MMTDDDDYTLSDSIHENGLTPSNTSTLPFEPSRLQLEEVPDTEDRPFETKFVIPFVSAAILAGAILGYFWKGRC